MSALEELWLWLQGRNSQTDTGSEATNRACGDQMQAALPEDSARASQTEKAEETQARVQRNNRYRAGPWQMK